MLIRTNMEDLREQTHTRHYELFRQRRLQQMGFVDVDSNNQPVSFQQTFESKRSDHLACLQAKEEEVRQMFVQRVKQKENELKDNEKELHTKFDRLKREHLEEKAQLEEARRQLEEDCQELQRRRLQMANGSHTLTLGRGKKK